jgi:hypothetical protein
MNLKDDDKKEQKDEEQEIPDEEQEVPDEEQEMPDNQEYIIDIDEVRASLMDQDFGKLSPVKKLIIKIPARKPNRHQWIRVHPKWKLEVHMFEDKDSTDKDIYLVGPKALEALAGEWTLKILYPYMDKRGDVFFWPITLPDENGAWNDWSESAYEAAQLAKKGWVRVASNKNVGAYDVFTPKNQEFEDPHWPTYDLRKLINIAFKDRYINDPEHEIIKKLHGA